MKFGINLLGLRDNRLVDIAVAAEELGFESVWLSDHLIMPGHVVEGAAHGPVPASLAVLDVGATLAYVAARTTTLRLGTWVYVLPLRHPMVTARTFQSVDVLSGGRAEIGVGVGYIREEFEAAGVDFTQRGKLMDESLAACKALWSDGLGSHRGAFYDFDDVSFEPKPLQRPWPRLHVGGESRPALRRAVREGHGWIGGEHTPASLDPVLSTLRELEAESPRDSALELTVGAGNVTGSVSYDELPPADAEMVRELESLGIDRAIVRPWQSPRDAIAGMVRFASECMS